MAINKRLIKSNDEGGVATSFNTVLYTGNGTSQAITGVGFQPDLVWIKNRTTTGYEHFWWDSVRGAGGNKDINSDSTNYEGEENTSAFGYLSSFDSNGFTLTSGTTSAVTINRSSDNYAAWCWKAGGYANTFNVLENGSTTSSATAAGAGITAGSITNGWSVSANRDAGFSVVSYTGNGTNATIGHGLDVAPKFIITKSRTVAQNWAVYHYDLGVGKWLQLNGTPAAITENLFGGVHPNSTTFSLNGNTVVNSNGSTNIAYCFAEVAGFSKFGSYTGNGSTDGPTITTGFEPAFVMLKRSDSTGDWFMFDNKRNPTNNRNKFLKVNDSAAEATGGVNDYVSFNADNFKLTSDPPSINGSGGTYIYMAFANQF